MYTKFGNENFDEIRKVENFLGYGAKYDCVWNDDHRAIVRLDEEYTTNLPMCSLYENKKYVGECLMEEAIEFLYGKKIYAPIFRTGNQ